ncbi:Chaperone protein HtpG [Dirofilaria immitis]
MLNRGSSKDIKEQLRKQENSVFSSWTCLQPFSEKAEFRMKPEQEHVYYLTGNSLDSVKYSPQLEGFINKELEVLQFIDPVDGPEIIGDLQVMSLTSYRAAPPQCFFIYVMILCSACTRACAFCNIATGTPDKLDPHEPESHSASSLEQT